MSFTRQEIIANNKSLRVIKTELDILLEKGVIDDNVFDQIHRALPNESPLSGGATPGGVKSPASPPVKSMANLDLEQNNEQPPPPAYNAAGPPSLPTRKNPPPPPPRSDQPPKAVLCWAQALYDFPCSNEGDLEFKKDTRIAVYQDMNEHWFLGWNQDTKQEGIFPKNYVRVDEKQGYGNEKAAPYGAPQPMYANNGYPAAPQAQNPYNSHVPPMAIASGSGSGGGTPGSSLANNPKVNENGKKFGKKLGNAAIFGAGATIGSNIVNGIF